MPVATDPVHRPRRPRETPFCRTRTATASFGRSSVKPVSKYLGCGDLKQGFARVRCRDYGHECLLAYSGKGRYFCTSCRTKRAVALSPGFITCRFFVIPWLGAASRER